MKIANESGESMLAQSGQMQVQSQGESGPKNLQNSTQYFYTPEYAFIKQQEQRQDRGRLTREWWDHQIWVLKNSEDWVCFGHHHCYQHVPHHRSHGDQVHPRPITILVSHHLLPHLQLCQHCHCQYLSSHLVIISVIRFLAILNLEKNRKAVYQNATLFTTKKVFWVLLECLIILTQPYPFFEGLYFETQNSYLKQKFLYPINDLLAILSLVRNYIIFRGLLLLTPYMNNRCN